MNQEIKTSLHHLLDELINMKLLRCATVNGVDLKEGFSDDELSFFCVSAMLKPVHCWYGTAWLANGDFPTIREINGGYWWNYTHVPPIPERLK